MSLRFIASRVVEGAFVCLGVSVLTFVLAFLVPADPVAAIAGIKASPETRRQIRHELGLDRPIWVQYGLYLGRLVRGDLGRSYVTQQEVSSLIKERIGPTAFLAVAAWSIAVLGGLALSVAAVLHQRVEPWLVAVSSLTLAMPAFWLGILLLYLFAFVLPIFPLGGYSAAGVVLPAVALGAGLAGGYFRILDGNLREALSQPFIQVALAKGLSERRAVIVHALRNAVLPLWSLVSLDLAGLLGGVTLTETVFHWPGLGRLAVEAVFNQDLPVLMGVVLVTTVLLVAVNTLAEIVYALIDPRFRSA